MAVIRWPEPVWLSVRDHLLGGQRERFAFLLARWSWSRGEPVFLVEDSLLIRDNETREETVGHAVQLEALIKAINAAVTSGRTLIEAHNHGGRRPRFSIVDRRGLREFVPYVLSSLPDRPYAATVWGDSCVYGEYFASGKRTGMVRSIAVYGQRLRQLVSRDDDTEAIAPNFDRQLPWFTAEGQREVGRLQVGVVGLGGTGSQLVQNLVYLGVRDFVLIEHDRADETSMNRLVTARAGDLGKHKGVLARELADSVAPSGHVELIDGHLESIKSLDALKGCDVLFGCIDNDGARLILNELAVAYGLPYFDLGVGIDAEDGVVSAAGGRVAVVLPGGPCLTCMGQLDLVEAHFFLASPEEQRGQIERGYVRGMNVPSPSVISLNAAVVAAAANEFAIYVSGFRPVSALTELDLLGVARPIRAQWLTPIRTAQRVGCVQCALSGRGDSAEIERYARR